MRQVKVITDSCSDLSPDILEKYDIDYAKMSTFLDGVETPASLEWTMDEVHAFYNHMRDGKRITTAQVSVAEFNRIFPLWLEKGYDVVYIGCSLKQSGSVNTGRVVSQMILEEYPDAKISCIDSMNASNGEGILAIEAAKLAKEGKSVDEITDYIVSIRKTVNQFVTVHTLDYLKRAGRVSASSAFFGNLMGVKPILISDKEGTQVAVKKVKGRPNSLREIVNSLKNGVGEDYSGIAFVAHADCSAEELNTVMQLMKEALPKAELHVGPIGPIIGASIGPEAFAVFAFGKEITFSASEK